MKTKNYLIAIAIVGGLMFTAFNTTANQNGEETKVDRTPRKILAESSVDRTPRKILAQTIVDRTPRKILAQTRKVDRTPRKILA